MMFGRREDEIKDQSLDNELEDLANLENLWL
jgi:hypothetical protein